MSSKPSVGKNPEKNDTIFSSDDEKLNGKDSVSAAQAQDVDSSDEKSKGKNSASAACSQEEKKSCDSDAKLNAAAARAAAEGFRALAESFQVDENVKDKAVFDKLFTTLENSTSLEDFTRKLDDYIVEDGFIADKSEIFKRFVAERDFTYKTRFFIAFFYKLGFLSIFLKDRKNFNFFSDLITPCDRAFFHRSCMFLTPQFEIDSATIDREFLGMTMHFSKDHQWVMVWFFDYEDDYPKKMRKDLKNIGGDDEKTKSFCKLFDPACYGLGRMLRSLDAQKKMTLGRIDMIYCVVIIVQKMFIDDLGFNKFIEYCQQIGGVCLRRAELVHRKNEYEKAQKLQQKDDDVDSIDNQNQQKASASLFADNPTSDETVVQKQLKPVFSLKDHTRSKNQGIFYRNTKVSWVLVFHLLHAACSKMRSAKDLPREFKTKTNTLFEKTGFKTVESKSFNKKVEWFMSKIIADGHVNHFMPYFNILLNSRFDCVMFAAKHSKSEAAAYYMKEMKELYRKNPFIFASIGICESFDLLNPIDFYLINFAYATHWSSCTQADTYQRTLKVKLLKK